MKKCMNTRLGPAAVGPYSTMTMTEDTVYVSGMIPLVPATGAIVEGGIREQAAQSLQNIKTVLEEAGLAMANVLKTTVLLTNLDDFATVNEVYASFFGSDYPARSCFEVSRLPKGAMIEIEAVAARSMD